MSTEQGSYESITLKGIYINVEERAIEFEDEHGTVGRILFSGEHILLEGRPFMLSGAEQSSGEPSEPQHDAPAAPQQEQREKQPLTTLTGRLLTQPKEGRPDSRSTPTAWARLAVLEEGREDAHLYSATFHRHTAGIALGLTKGTPITVEGYPHVRTNPADKRLDTFSVINVVAYPGKPERSPRRPRRRS